MSLGTCSWSHIGGPLGGEFEHEQEQGIRVTDAEPVFNLIIHSYGGHVVLLEHPNVPVTARLEAFATDLGLGTIVLPKGETGGKDVLLHSNAKSDHRTFAEMLNAEDLVKHGVLKLVGWKQTWVIVNFRYTTHDQETGQTLPKSWTFEASNKLQDVAVRVGAKGLKFKGKEVYPEEKETTLLAFVKRTPKGPILNFEVLL